MNAASPIFQNSQLTMYRSLYAGFYSSGSDVYPPKFSSREVRLFFDPQVPMVCLHTLCKFRLFVDIWFTNSFFAERFGHFFFFLIVPMNPLLFLHIWVPKGVPTSRVLVQVNCRGLCSPFPAVPIYIALSIFPIEVCRLVPKRVYTEWCTFVCWLRHIIHVENFQPHLLRLSKLYKILLSNSLKKPTFLQLSENSRHLPRKLTHFSNKILRHW